MRARGWVEIRWGWLIPPEHSVSNTICMEQKQLVRPIQDVAEGAGIVSVLKSKIYLEQVVYLRPFRRFDFRPSAPRSRRYAALPLVTHFLPDRHVIGQHNKLHGSTLCNVPLSAPLFGVIYH